MESNAKDTNQRWIPLRPPFAQDQAAWEFFVCRAQEVETLVLEHSPLSPHVLRDFRARTRDDVLSLLGTRYQTVRLALSVLCDLVMHGWNIRVDEVGVYICRPSRNEDRRAEKERVRQTLLLAREEQLVEKSVQDFVRSMEARRPGPNGWVSIFSLMRDGQELAHRLKEAAGLPLEAARLKELRHVVAPYLQFVTEDARCEQTGLRLADVWRYFRYTWLTPARSTPGRQMMILVRDAAVEAHPVIGIAALSSSIVQQSERDRIIGWDRQSLLDEIQHRPTDALAAWLLRSLDEMLRDIRTDDLVSENEIAAPTQTIIDRLNEIGRVERDRHRDRARDIYYRQLQEAEEWGRLSATHLYRSKRALTLADLLSVRLRFQESGLMSASADRLVQAALRTDVQGAIARLVRAIKAARVGIHMMDISVAGAIAPYNAILGGKLVSMLLTSPEIREAYSQRYGQMPSVIASAMKGSSVIRQPHLVLLCTTGLFAGGSSQYNRIRVPANCVGDGHGEVRFLKLREETSFATFHISVATQQEMRIHAEQWHDGSDINFIFGEGVNPRMRQLREGLSRIGFPPEEILQAASPRTVYIIPLAHNYRHVLLGKVNLPDYILQSNDAKEATQRIVDYWRERWLLGRIQQGEVLLATQRHRKTFPLLHGAAVDLPETVDEDQTSMLSQLYTDDAPEDI